MRERPRHAIPNRLLRSAVCASSFNSACASLPLVTMAVSRHHAERSLRDIHLMLRLRMLHLLLLRRSFQMRIEQRHLGIELSLDFREFDFGLGLDLLMNGVVLRFLLLDLRPMRGGGLIGLRPRLHGEQLWVGRSGNCIAASTALRSGSCMGAERSFLSRHGRLRTILRVIPRNRKTNRKPERRQNSAASIAASSRSTHPLSSPMILRAF
jgi:hypothetical protein